MKLADIDFDSSAKALVPCRRCGCIAGEVWPSKGGQPGNMLRCAGCGSFHGWLSPSHPKFIGPKEKPAWRPSDDDVIDLGDIL